nr:retrovirus-related Pol polyprotein from transposon TNT 1-94 [Tanacetum cinerariifolium]
MKEKGDECIFVGYSTQSRAYRVFNKRTRVIMESIHVNFDELPQMASAHFIVSRGTDLYSITLQESNSPNPICLMAKATSSQAWLWHRRLSHLNFDTINFRSKNDIVVGLPKLKFIKDHLCSSCELGKAKRKSFHSKLTPSSKRRLHLLHMDLCGPMRVASIKRKRYVLVQRGPQAQVRVVQTDKGTEFLNQTLHAYFAAEGIQHQTFMTESVLKSAKKKTGSRSSRSVVIQDTLSAPKPKPATLMPKLKGPGTEGSSEGTGTIPGVLDESTVVSAPSNEGTGTKPGVLDEEKEGDVDDEGDDHISDTQDTDDEDAKIKSDEDEIYKYKIRVRKDENVEMTNAEVEDFEKATPVTTLPHLSISTIPPAPLQQTTAPVHPPPIITDGPIITFIVSNSDALSVVQLRVAKLEKDVFKLKKIDHSAKALATLKSQVPMIVEQYNGSKIKDENAIDKGVADTVKDHKRKHDDDDDDDENPPVGTNQGKKTKRSRTKESKSSKKPSITKETPKDKAPSKGSKTGKSASTKEPVEELNVEVVMDVGEDVVHDDD